MNTVTSPLRNAFFFSLCAVALSLVAIKMLTGLALVPLAVIGMFVFVFGFGLKLRVDRGAGRGTGGS